MSTPWERQRLNWIRTTDDATRLLVIEQIILHWTGLATEDSVLWVASQGRHGAPLLVEWVARRYGGFKERET